MKTIAPLVLGSAGVTNSIWLEYLPIAWQVLIAILGAIVLVLTIYNKWLEAKQRRKDLQR